MMTTDRAMVTSGQQMAIEGMRGFDPLVSLVLDGLTSAHSRRAYGRALEDFLTWWARNGKPQMSKAVVQRHKRELQDADFAPSTINLRLSAIRKLALEASDNGLIPPNMAAGIARVKGVTAGGRRTGNWLTKEQAQRLIDAPNIKTLAGLRDRAILAVLLGAGLRRSEAADLTFAHVQQREGRWVLVDLVGKRNKTRSVPIAPWVKAAIDEWANVARLSEGRVFRAVHRSGLIMGDGMTPQAVYNVVEKYGKVCGLDVAAHDLRRTFAKLARNGGGRLEQIQLSLGHASIKTTERYLGTEQDLTDAPGDYLGLRLG